MFDRVRLWWQNQRQQNEPENPEPKATEPDVIPNRSEPSRAQPSEPDPLIIPTASPAYPQNYPASFPRLSSDAQARRVKVFDPSLKHYTHAYTLADPRFQDEATAEEWRQARSQVIAHLLQLIGNSLWQKHLVLRGSLLLKAWLGDVAREPKDIDWVFQPGTVGKDEPLGQKLFDDLRQLVTETPIVNDGKIALQVNKICTDEIWTYERASGRRILFPWQAEGLPPSEVQMDVVFQEELPESPIPMDIVDIVGPLAGIGKSDRPTIPNTTPNTTQPPWLWVASRRLSLAWKVMWLATDSYPQGKDWYDATLLAEQVELPISLLETVLKNLDEGWVRDLHANQLLDPDDLDLDWDNFVQEYPGIEGDIETWKSRFFNALGPTLQLK